MKLNLIVESSNVATAAFEGYTMKGLFHITRKQNNGWTCLSGASALNIIDVAALNIDFDYIMWYIVGMGWNTYK